MKKSLAIVVFLVLLVFLGKANAISVGTFGNIDLWVTNASRVTGTGGDYAGVDAVAALIGDDLTDGAINIDSNSSFLLTYPDQTDCKYVIMPMRL